MEEVNWSSVVTASVGKNSVDSFSMRPGFHSYSEQKHMAHGRSRMEFICFFCSN